MHINILLTVVGGEIGGKNPKVVNRYCIAARRTDALEYVAQKQYVRYVAMGRYSSDVGDYGPIVISSRPIAATQSRQQG